MHVEVVGLISEQLKLKAQSVIPNSAIKSNICCFVD